MSNDADAAKEYAEAGVDLPELAEEKKEEAEAPKPEAPEEAPAEEEAKAEPEAPPQEPKEPRKRSIYDDLKDKKAELKSEKELREQAERERNDLQEKLDAATKAETPETRKEAKDEIDEFISSHKEWDKPAIQELLALARRGFKAEIPDDVATDLKDFREWKNTHAKDIEAAQFAQELDASLPAIKEVLPNATDDEMKAIGAELNKLAHTKEFHDKPLDYIAFKNRETLSTLISPKKRGLEKKGRADAGEVQSEFDPAADYASMTPEERGKWEENYTKVTASAGLHTDTQGRRIIL